MLLTSAKSSTAARALLLLLAASPCLAVLNGTEKLDDSDARLDAFLETTLLQAFAKLVQPDSLLEHVKEGMQDKVQESPSLQKGAADCELALARWGAGLRYLETWAIQMVDSSSKLVTGVLYGDLADLGNFDECLAAGPGGPTSSDTEDGNGFTGRYSLASLAVQSIVTPTVTPGPLQAELERRRVRASNETTEYKALATIRMALCVPSTCTAPIVEAAMVSVFRPINALVAGLGYHVVPTMREEYTAVAGPFRKGNAGDFVIITLCVVLLFLMLIASVIDIALSPSAKKTRDKIGMLLAFSAWTNGRRLLTVAPPSDSNFTCINGIRFLSAAWVILGHRYRFGLEVPFTNLLTIPKRASDASTMAIANAPLSVDTFFLIGGMVNCYAFMRSQTGRRSFNIVMYYVHRYVRLTPAFAMMVAITATWVSLLGTGPLWYTVVQEPADHCSKWWWTALLYVANYANPGEQCMMQSWYLMVDMQLHILSPLVLIPLWKYRRIGLSWLGVVILASCAVPFAVTYVNKFRSPVSTDLSRDAQRHFMKLIYYPMHTRITSYACGTLAGYFLWLIKTGQYTRKISTNEVIFGWVMSTALCLTVVFGAQPLFDTEHHEYNVWESSIYMGLYRLAWSAGICWVVFACILGHGGPVNAFLSWTPMAILGRLTYGIYLTHAAVQMVDVGAMRTSDYYSDFKMVERMLSDLVLATVCGALLSLSLESPITAIEKSLRAPRARKPREAPQDNNGLSSGVINSGFVADDGKLKQTLDAEKAAVPVTQDSAEPAAEAATAPAQNSAV
ncbi:O-acyltransferase like protein-like [Thrips palmi]|uniref:O-acyltransferase like protein-like n=1 Tax=Thrips palmi TaxID=161013 RepID=A0A6P9A6G4_THRPL|nr:O-acyltransferase like protein-like [Thrips palmi]